MSKVIISLSNLSPSLSAAPKSAAAKIPTSPENLAKINKMYSGMQKLVISLFHRWQDEQGLEDIKEYGANISKKLPKGFTLTRMTKKPFGFEFSIGTEVLYSVRIVGTKYSWVRVK
jgi:hypothetical protein